MSEAGYASAVRARITRSLDDLTVLLQRGPACPWECVDVLLDTLSDIAAADGSGVALNKTTLAALHDFNAAVRLHMFVQHGEGQGELW